LSSKRKFSNVVKSHAGNLFKVINIRPEEDGIFGIIIDAYGYVERVMTDPLYKRKRDINAIFIELIDCIPFVFTLVELDSDPKCHLMNANNYPKKAIVVLGDLTEEEIINYFEDTLIPAIVGLGQLKENSYPIRSPEGFYRETSTWSDVLMDDQVEDLFKWAFVNGDDKPFGQLEDFLKEDQAHLYSGWKEGQVPISVIRDYSLRDDHLRQGDAARVAFDPGAQGEENAANEEAEEAKEEEKVTRKKKRSISKNTCLVSKIRRRRKQKRKKTKQRHEATNK
jgi:hypothetical protein